MVANFYVLAKPLQSDEGIEERSCDATRPLSGIRPKAETEPEERLWKVCAEAVSPRFSALESLAFVFFGALAIGALACCFSELFQLISSGALDQTVHALLKK
jgi:hypothetical protein